MRKWKTISKRWNFLDSNWSLCTAMIADKVSSLIFTSVDTAAKILSLKLNWALCLSANLSLPKVESESHFSDRFVWWYKHFWNQHHFHPNICGVVVQLFWEHSRSGGADILRIGATFAQFFPMWWCNFSYNIIGVMVQIFWEPAFLPSWNFWCSGAIILGMVVRYSWS